MSTTALLDATTNLAALKAGEIEQQYRDLVRQVATATGEKGPTPEVILKTLPKLGRTEGTFRRDVERLMRRLDLRARFDRLDDANRRQAEADAKYKELWAAHQATIADIEAKFEAEAGPLREAYECARGDVVTATNAGNALKEEADESAKNRLHAAAAQLRPINEEIARLEAGLTKPDLRAVFLEDGARATPIQIIEQEIKEIREKRHDFGTNQVANIAAWKDLRAKELADAERRLAVLKEHEARDLKRLDSARARLAAAQAAVDQAEAALLEV